VCVCVCVCVCEREREREGGVSTGKYLRRELFTIRGDVSQVQC
jgi:hypothetical protein